jgi:hypothetical protein
MAGEKGMDWISFIRDAYSRGVSSKSTKVSPIFHPPAPRQSIDECEKHLGVKFPEQLEQLLLQTNGVSEQVSTKNGNVNSGYFVLSVESILKTNLFLRANDFTMPLECLLFFADDGVGDYFGFAVTKNQVTHSRIYFWDHEDDSHRSIAPSLPYFKENWILGKIKV